MTILTQTTFHLLRCLRHSKSLDLMVAHLLQQHRLLLPLYAHIRSPTRNLIQRKAHEVHHAMAAAAGFLPLLP